MDQLNLKQIWNCQTTMTKSLQILQICVDTLYKV